MNETNQKIIDAVIARADKVCPDSLALIGVYGSVATGDDYEKSDLDLLILIKDDAGWQLGSGFILEDTKIGYDIYCTNWEGLLWESGCHHARLSKLLDARILYVRDSKEMDKLTELRKQTIAYLGSSERMEKVHALAAEARQSYREAAYHSEQALGFVRSRAAEVINFLLSAIMLYHGCYFKRGVKLTFDELSVFPLQQTFLEELRETAACKDRKGLVTHMARLISYVETYTGMQPEGKTGEAGGLTAETETPFPADREGEVKSDTEIVPEHSAPCKAAPSPDNIAGTYEEMYSNWRNKVTEAAEKGDVFSAFLAMASLQGMIDEVGEEVDIGSFDVLSCFDPDRLQSNEEIYDRFLDQYEEAYRRAGLKINRFADVDQWVQFYRK